MKSLVVQLLSYVQLFATPWTATRQALLSPRVFSDSYPLNQWRHPIISSSGACFLLLLPSIFPSIRVFSSESALRIMIGAPASSNSPSNEYSGLISFRIDWFDLLAVLEVPSAVKFPESESRTESGCLGLGRRRGSWCLMGTGFQFCRSKELDGEQGCTTKQMCWTLLNCTL